MALLMLAACASGPVRRVSEPAASIQQLSVGNDGRWTVELRINNYSSVPMRFDSIALALTVGDEDAVQLQAQPGLSIGPESTDVVSLTLAPSPAARIAMAVALTSNRSISYNLRGELRATPDAGSQRTYQIERNSALSPVPGLAGVLR